METSPPTHLVGQVHLSSPRQQQPHHSLMTIDTGTHQCRRALCDTTKYYDKALVLIIKPQKTKPMRPIMSVLTTGMWNRDRSEKFIHFLKQAKNAPMVHETATRAPLRDRCRWCRLHCSAISSLHQHFQYRPHSQVPQHACYKHTTTINDINSKRRSSIKDVNLMEY